MCSPTTFLMLAKSFTGNLNFIIQEFPKWSILSRTVGHMPRKYMYIWRFISAVMRVARVFA